MTATRDRILTRAGDLINGDRARDYGDAAKNFQRIADLWKPILGTDVTPAQVALCLTQLKVARLITSPQHQDSWVDAAGYIALGGEVAAAPVPPARKCEGCHRAATHETVAGTPLCGPCWTAVEGSAA